MIQQMRTMRRMRTTPTRTATIIAIVRLDSDPDVYENLDSQSEPVEQEPEQEENV